MSMSSDTTGVCQRNSAPRKVVTSPVCQRTPLARTAPHPFVWTDAQRRFAQFCDTCREYGYCGLYTGASGSGLSWAARRYAHWDIFMQVLARPYLVEVMPPEVAAILWSCHTLLLSPVVRITPTAVRRELVRLRRALHAVHERILQLPQQPLPPLPLMVSPLSIAAGLGSSHACTSPSPPSPPSTLSSHMSDMSTRASSALCGHGQMEEVNGSRPLGDMRAGIGSAPALATGARRGRGLLYLLIVDEADLLPLALLEDLCRQADEDRYGLIALGSPQFADRVQACISLRRLIDYSGRFGALQHAEVATIVQRFEEQRRRNSGARRQSALNRRRRARATRAIRAVRVARATNMRAVGARSAQVRGLCEHGGGNLRTLLHLLQRAAWDQWNAWDQSDEWVRHARTANTTRVAYPREPRRARARRRRVTTSITTIRAVPSPLSLRALPTEPEQ